VVLPATGLADPRQCGISGIPLLLEPWSGKRGEIDGKAGSGSESSGKSQESEELRKTPRACEGRA
jgi:hypothetical protein